MNKMNSWTSKLRAPASPQQVQKWLKAQLPSSDEFWGRTPPAVEERRRYSFTDERDIGDLFKELGRSRYLVATIVAIFTLASVVIALLQPKLYEVDALLVSTAADDAQSSKLSQLTGLAAIAGLSSEPTISKSAIWIASLQSRDFIREFIDKYDVMPVLFADEWDARTRKWKVPPADQPDIRDAIKQFKSDILKVSQDPTTGLITLSITWSDPHIAKLWADGFIALFNSTSAVTDRKQAYARYAYLKNEVLANSNLTMQDDARQLMQSELQTIMLTNVDPMYAFHIIDPPVEPKPDAFVWPKKKLIVLAGSVAGVFVSMLVVLFRTFGKPQARPNQES